MNGAADEPQIHRVNRYTNNRAHLVSKAIETAMSQTVPCEVIVSTDNTQQVIANYRDKVRYIRRVIVDRFFLGLMEYSLPVRNMYT